MCVCCDIYIDICVCEVKIFLPFKRRDDVEQTKHKHVSVRFEKREKKSNQKSAEDFFLESHTILHLFVSHYVIYIITWN